MRRPARRPLATLAALTSLAVGAALLPGQAGGAPAPAPATVPAAAHAAPAQPATTLAAARQGRVKAYRATVTRTEHGIPHVVADDYGSLGYGSGYATARTSICTLADTLLTGRGERSRYLGADETYDDRVTLSATNLQVDALATDLRNREVVEQLLADPVRGPGEETKAMVRGYVAGINRWLREQGGAAGVSDPACRGADYLDQEVTPVDLWYGVYFANLLASTGVFVPQIVEAAPASPGDPGLPEAPAAAAVDRDALLKGLGKDPASPFGSNATAVGSAETTTGKGMLLGNPHFPWVGRYRFTQQHLTIPGEYDIAGASLIGSPVVNIGFNADVAWSHTVSTAYRFTPYEYPLADGRTTVVTEGGPKRLEHRTVEVEVKRGGGLETVTEDLYRTDVGYVLDAPELFMGWTPTSVWSLRDANAEHLRTVDTFHEMAKAHDVRDLLAAQDRGAGMPWVNTIAADRDGHALYADHSVVPNVPDDLAQECMTPVGRVLFEVAGLPGLNGALSRSECAWQDDEDAARPGIFGPDNLPDTVRDDWVVNANDSYWLPNPDERLEGFARIIGCEECERSLRTRMVYRYVLDRLAGRDGLAGSDQESPRTLRASEHENRVLGAELMRENGDLDAVCQATGETDACAALAAWDGRSETDSRGNHLYEEFFDRLPTDGTIWEVPFDPADPVHTPRDLAEANPQVVQAMDDAIEALRDRGIPFDAAWGELHVAGDRGAPALAVGGGSGFAGNANVTDSRSPVSNRDRLSPVDYGSSHIQAVSFLPGGRVQPRTVLTYGQSENPRSPWSRDQTAVFGDERWVAFPWTDAQIRRQRIGRTRLVGR